MKTPTPKIFFTFVAFLFLLGCTKDFRENNLEKAQVILLSPPDNYNTTEGQLTFWWEKTDAATHYEIQVVSPSFATPNDILLNVITDTNLYTLSLSPGVYQWRVKALNHSSETNYSVRSLQIDTTTDLSQQTVTLVSPSINAITNQNVITFTWSSVYSATAYRFLLINSQNGNTVIDDTVPTNGYILTINQGTYQWQVKAMNPSSSTAYSTPRLVTIDFTPPTTSVQSTPLNNAMVSNPISLGWLRNNNAVGDSIYIDTDSLFLSPELLDYTLNQIYIFNGLQDSTYYWRLKSVDQAGNTSPFSPLRKFIVQ